MAAEPDALSQLLAAIRRDGLDRRRWLAYAASLASIPLLDRRAQAAVGARRAWPEDPFALGVASGDPTPTGVVLWTRLAPRPLDPDGGAPREPVDVMWEVADDESMGNVVARGREVALPQLSHSIHAEADGLRPDRWYWYRFRCGDAESPIGRTRTLPAWDAKPERLRLAFASCQRFEAGFYTAYQHMAEEELDLVLHLGDYIYEKPKDDPAMVRRVLGGEVKSLADYRIRYAQYRSDPNLQAAHARCPWLVTWDDHEVQNNYADDRSEDRGVPPHEFLRRRANAYQAYYEAMPLRRRSVPRGPDLQLYRKASFGRLAELLVLDTRQYRSDQPYDDKTHPLDQRVAEPGRSLLGARQRGWLESSLLQSPAAWNVLAQQVMMAMCDMDPGQDRAYGMDSWPGYLHERRQLIRFLRDRLVANPIVLTGDFHANVASDLRVDDRRLEDAVIASELVGTSISSDGDGGPDPKHEALRTQNPHVKFSNAERGYVSCTITPEAWRADFRCVPYVTRPDAPIATRASLVVESGNPGLQQS
jgi:alkaline phosphatase D